MGQEKHHEICDLLIFLWANNETKKYIFKRYE